MEESSKRTSRFPSMATINIPQDLTAEILSRLPIKSLMRFKCVSRSMCSLISQDFDLRKKHIKESNSARAILFVQDDDREEVFSCPLLALTSDEPNISLDHESVTKLEIPLEVRETGDRIKISNSCDGLFCITSKRGIFVWNPSTRYLKKVPDSQVAFGTGTKFIQPVEFSYDLSYTCGLTYDSSSDDHKVLLICSSSFRFYSLKTDSWKTFNAPEDYSWTNWSWTLSNGTFHWIATVGRDGPLVIVSLGITDGKFKKLAPPPIPLLGDVIFNINVMGGKLCFYDRRPRISWDLWVMEEYGVVNSWIKKLSIPVDEFQPVLDKLCYWYWYPFYLFEDGKIMLTILNGQRKRVIVIYSQGRLVSKMIDNRDISEAYVWDETLTSPH